MSLGSDLLHMEPTCGLSPSAGGAVALKHASHLVASIASTRAARNKIKPGKCTPVAGLNEEVVRTLGTNAPVMAAGAPASVGVTHGAMGPTEGVCTVLRLVNMGSIHESDVTVVRATGGALPAGGMGNTGGTATGASPS